MRKTFFSLCLLFLFCCQAGASPQDAVLKVTVERTIETYDPPAGVFRTKETSHGSGTVIFSNNVRTLVLTCEHTLGGERNHATVWINGLATKAKVVQADQAADLALLEFPGHFPHTCPLAPESYKLGNRFRSCGFDEGGTRGRVDVPVSVIGAGSERIFTREKPISGRSGGALIDAEAQVVVGVVVAAVDLPYPRGHGIHVSHQKVRQLFGDLLPR